MTDLAAVIEALGDGVLVAAADGRVISANAALARMTGREAAKLDGMLLGELLEGAPAEGEGRARLRRADGTRLAVLAAVTGAGEMKVVRVKDLRPWIGPPSTRVAGRAEIEGALGEVFRGAMAGSGEEFESEDDVDRLAQLLAEQAVRILGVDDCVIDVVVEPRPQTFRVAGASGPWGETLVGNVHEYEGSLLARALESRRPFESPDAPSESSLGALMRGHVRTVRAVPFYAERPLPDGRTGLGGVLFCRRSDEPFDEQRRLLMDDFASLVSLYVQRAVLRRAARLASERLGLGVSLAVELNRSLAAREVTWTLLRRTVAAVQAERAVLLRVEGEDTVVVDSHDVTGQPDLVGYRHPIARQRLMERALATRSPVLGGGYEAALLPDRLRSALEGVRHTLSVPLELGGEVVAVMVLSRRTDRAFGADEVATVQIIGSVGVLALRNAWLFEEAREASRLKSDFLNMAAHELRTPLTVISGYLSLLRDGSFGPPPEGVVDSLDMLEAKAGELGRLVEDLLLASRLEAGNIPMTLQHVDLAELAREAVTRARPRAQLAGADLEVEAPAAGLVVEGDPEHLGRILDNLVNNAINYSNTSPWVRVRVLGTPARVEIEDHGRGIAEADRHRIFERFYRGGEPARAALPGTGLGLYISRQLAEREGARLELEWSEVGAGSRFVLTARGGAG